MSQSRSEHTGAIIHVAPPTEVPLALRPVNEQMRGVASPAPVSAATPVPLAPASFGPPVLYAHGPAPAPVVHQLQPQHAQPPVQQQVQLAVAAPAPVPPPAPVAVSGTLTQFKTPKNTVLTIVKAGIAKADLPWQHAFALAVYGGAYVALGATLSVVVAGGLTSPGAAGLAVSGTLTTAATNVTAAQVELVTLTVAVPPSVVKAVAGAVFPIGLMLIVICGAELFTGNVMYLSLALYAGKTTWQKAAVNLFVVYAGNLCGALIFAYFFAYLTDTVSSEPYLSYVQHLAVAKVVPHWGRLLLRGVMCNILVGIALWFAIAAEDVPGKLMGVWAPIFLFAVCGYEHSVANMVYGPLALLHPWTATVQPEINTADFIVHNLIPVTVGNIIGAAVFLALFYFWIFQPHMALALEAMQTAPGVPKHVKRAAAYNKLIAVHHAMNTTAATATTAAAKPKEHSER